MLHGYKYRIYPTAEQKVMLAKTFGCCRYVYNWALDEREKAYQERGRGVSMFNMIKRVKAMRDGELPWLKEVSSQALSYTVLDLYRGYSYFFQGLANRPQHHIKYSRQHFRDEGKNTTVDFERGLVSVTKIRKIPCVFHRPFKGKIMGASLELRPSGHYYIALLVDEDIAVHELEEMEIENTLGIDVGMTHYAALSDGELIDDMETSEKENRKIRKLMRQRSKKKQGSRQYNILSKRIAKQFEHIANIRNDRIHKLAHRLAFKHEATAICVEDLYVEGIKRNKHFANKMSDLAFGMFFHHLEYKCKMAGKRFVKISKFAPSSKMCSHCGYIKRDLDLNVRAWTCPECGTHHDRDINAAINIQHFGLGEKSPYPRYWGKVTPVEQPTVDDRSLEPKKQRRDSQKDETGKLKGECPDAS